MSNRNMGSPILHQDIRYHNRSLTHILKVILHKGTLNKVTPLLRGITSRPLQWFRLRSIINSSSQAHPPRRVSWKDAWQPFVAAVCWTSVVVIRQSYLLMPDLFWLVEIESIQLQATPDVTVMV